MFEAMEKYNNFDFKETKFKGYDNLKTNSKILGIFNQKGESVDSIQNQKAFVIFDSTPFYAMGGGQESDNGYIYNDQKKFFVEDLRKDIVEGYYIHLVDIDNGSIKVDEEFTLEFNSLKRDLSSINHSALHTTWQNVLNFAGHYIGEVGSKLNDEKYQLQFENDSVLDEELVMKVTNHLNENVYTKDIKCNIFYVDQKTAAEKGYLYEFTKLKPNEMVRIVEFPGIVLEPCSGTHVNSTKEIKKTYFLDFDKNKDRTLFDMTTNKEYAKKVFTEKIDNKVNEILNIQEKIKNIDNTYKFDNDFKDFLNNEKVWNYLTIKLLNDEYNKITKEYNIVQKEEQKKLSNLFDTLDLKNKSIIINNIKIGIYTLANEKMTDKILVPKAMKLAKENSEQKDVVILDNISTNVLILVSNNKELNLIDKFNNLNNNDIKGGGNPKLLVLNSETIQDMEKLLNELF